MGSKEQFLAGLSRLGWFVPFEAEEFAAGGGEGGGPVVGLRGIGGCEGVAERPAGEVRRGHHPILAARDQCASRQLEAGRGPVMGELRWGWWECGDCVVLEGYDPDILIIIYRI